ncbi:hypothetical protein MOD31_18735 [Paenarthrobacter sp. TYUT067]|uniref:hypothetical protein n=1 Tax=Paenarthrobacter sp. TYUT067 TaxID=2926245 RepID=UPI00202DF36F|nr:hypothetical protein [Paenarthrobacter sp. TYUT067]MCM0618061.1 hypothetical protein [Paenarthrobacter sp. TYUT067]
MDIFWKLTRFQPSTWCNEICALDAAATYVRVTAESGESVIVEQSGFDGRVYAVYEQESFFVFRRSLEGTSVLDVFDPDA